MRVGIAISLTFGKNDCRNTMIRERFLWVSSLATAIVLMVSASIARIPGVGQSPVVAASGIPALDEHGKPIYQTSTSWSDNKLSNSLFVTALLIPLMAYFLQPRSKRGLIRRPRNG